MHALRCSPASPKRDVAENQHTHRRSPPTRFGGRHAYELLKPCADYSSARATSIFLITLASMAYVWVKHVENNAPSASTSSGSSSTLFDKDRDMPLDRRDGGDEEKEDQVPLLNKGSEQV